MVVSCIGYLVPSVAVIAGVRLLHGTAWAAFNTGANAALADLAPPARRGEASGIFSLMPSLSAMVMPSVGLILLGLAGAWLAFVAATLFAIAALLVATPRAVAADASVRRRSGARATCAASSTAERCCRCCWSSCG